MIFITGDIHSDVTKFNMESFPEQKIMTKNDYVIILGDFGLVWNKDVESKYEKYWLDWLDTRSFTTLFIDGNHENYDRLNAYPKEEWNGGLVQKIRPSVIHLCRGEIFNIEGCKFLAMGGANSHDIKDGVLEIGDSRIKEWKHDYSKYFRINHLSWWKEEIPNQLERDNAIKNLASVNNTVDYILTHEAPASTIFFVNSRYKPSEYALWLEESVRQQVNYKKWFFGHYHIDKIINDKEIVLFDQITNLPINLDLINSKNEEPDLD